MELRRTEENQIERYNVKKLKRKKEGELPCDVKLIKGNNIKLIDDMWP